MLILYKQGHIAAQGKLASACLEPGGRLPPSLHPILRVLSPSPSLSVSDSGYISSEDFLPGKLHTTMFVFLSVLLLNA